MKTRLTFEEMNRGEEKQIFELVKSVFEEFVAPDFSPAGVANFMDYIYRTLFWSGKRMDARDYDHISLFFVNKHHQGIAKALYTLALEKCKQCKADLTELEVYSSRCAAPVYEKLGFKPTGEERQVDGIIFTPMKAKVSPDSAEAP